MKLPLQTIEKRHIIDLYPAHALKLAIDAQQNLDFAQFGDESLRSHYIRESRKLIEMVIEKLEINRVAFNDALLRTKE
jgi:hypothetical protein